MHIVAGNTASFTRNQAIAAMAALALTAAVAGGVAFQAWQGPSDLLSVQGGSLPENTRPMILVPLPR
ncbi:hypothetical protein [Skermanella pratensis]|uniref:hypothetical protein n=1 Tax=Skermanella pratensis TaxID=2233999 RepID=UPI001301552C|nr:hypothetical protein [Skermanella pratensis]